MSATTTAPASLSNEGFWDGQTHAYLPSRDLLVPSGTTLNSETTDDVVPITYEVVRHGLWNGNFEHGRVIENLALSPIAVEIRDFQTCILTEDAQLVYFGPSLQYMTGQLDLNSSTSSSAVAEPSATETCGCPTTRSSGPPISGTSA